MNTEICIIVGVWVCEPIRVCMCVYVCVYLCMDVPASVCWHVYISIYKNTYEYICVLGHRTLTFFRASSDLAVTITWAPIFAR